MPEANQRGFDDSVGAKVHIRLLPRLEVTVDAMPLALKPRSERLLALLALSRGSLRRATAAGMLWPGATTDRAMTSLRTTLWNLPKHPPLVSHAGVSTIELACGIQVDLHDAMREIHRLVYGKFTSDPGDCPMELLTAELLPDWDEDWIRVEQETFRQMRLLGLEALCVMATERGCYARAIEAGLAAVACEPLRERAHRLLITAHLAAGNRYEAIHQFGHCAGLLRDELGLAPTREMTNLLTAATGHPGTDRGVPG